MNKSEQFQGRSVLYIMTWASRYPQVFLLALLMLVFDTLRFRLATGLVACASSFYSACGYAVNEKKGLKKYLLIAVGGGGALAFAFLATIVKLFFKVLDGKTVWEYFSPTDADVLGTIFTRAKWYSWAQSIFRSLNYRYGRGTSVSDKTIALACKWYAENPRHSARFVEDLKQKVRRLAYFHAGEWDETILCQLEAFTGSLEHARIRRHALMENARLYV